MTALLEVKDLTLRFNTDEGRITAVEKVSFSLDSGEVLGLVGESGSGKSVTAKALMKLNPSNALYGEDSSIPPQLGLRDRRYIEPEGREAAPSSARRGHFDDLPGADGELRACDHHRQADGRAA